MSENGRLSANIGCICDSADGLLTDEQSPVSFETTVVPYNPTLDGYPMSLRWSPFTWWMVNYKLTMVANEPRVVAY